MKILAIDTSAQTAAVAVVDGDTVIGEYILNYNKTHSQKLMVLVERMLSDLELDVSGIDLFAAAEGPGSFTGLRIGIATVKALAHSVNKPVVGISTLEGLARNLPFADGLIVPIMDARNNQVFNAAYKWNGGGLKEIIAPNACGIDECVERAGKNAIFTGDGATIYSERIIAANAKTAPSNARLSRAASIADAARACAEAGQTLHYTALTPKYLRLSQAERELRKKSKGE